MKTKAEEYAALCRKNGTKRSASQPRVVLPDHGGEAEVTRDGDLKIRDGVDYILLPRESVLALGQFIVANYTPSR